MNEKPLNKEDRVWKVMFWLSVILLPYMIYLLLRGGNMVENAKSTSWSSILTFPLVNILNIFSGIKRREKYQILTSIVLLLPVVAFQLIPKIFF
ncbi:hypothetical protein [Clostridium polynesiense]|uniref:hypothetical protein n=1 Tax=Clostridium polynesiense TaxID=1325933 RepID=UPI00058DAC6B|nr:hypothetical protein [Clostridium polynesiense]